MGKVQIITDSASDISPEMVTKLGIKVVPLTVRFDDDVFADGKDIDVDEFYARMAREDELPQTSAPSPGQFEEAFRQAADEGAETIVCITLSSKLSATGQSAEIAAQAVKEKIKVHTLDSLSATIGEALLVQHAVKLAEAGKSGEEICEAVEQKMGRLRCFGILNTLENLKKGGRVGKAKAMVASALHFKPIVDLSSGQVEEAGKVRTRKKSFEWIKNKITEIGPPEALAINHACAKDWNELLEYLADTINIEETYQGKVGPVIGTHAGEGAIGIAYILK